MSLRDQIAHVILFGVHGLCACAFFWISFAVKADGHPIAHALLMGWGVFQLLIGFWYALSINTAAPDRT